ncbi:hypothetical protein GCM10008995_28660 [Halobellus salinus]|uniref:Uncharacterized protein n=1 Tax=Halobellus salinus TaxID=931585 RepID=A0A830EE89_9EURY|nr:hypothetical protein [Halobellus salinus]GGJ17026.1 hypothetical protein GCM10008995_28660 [Halobellus salinus]SMP34400.1 hypothetical protein SAMN06265347_12613 [Halobellus salinus]
MYGADLQAISTVGADEYAVGENVIRINGDDYGLFMALSLKQSKYRVSIHFER